MFLMAIEISKGHTGIKYNTKEDLGTDKTRGSVLPDGGINRGNGTHFPSPEAAQRYAALQKDETKLRMAVEERFMKARFIKGVFVENELGEAQKYVDEFRQLNAISSEIVVDIVELDVNAVVAKDHQVTDWEAGIKDQIERVRIGQKKGQVSTSALDTLERLADCPLLNAATAGAVRKLVGQFRMGGMLKDDFQRSIQLLEVKVDRDALSGPKRAMPEGI